MTCFTPRRHRAAVRAAAMLLLAVAGGLAVFACGSDIQGPPGSTQPVEPPPESAPFAARSFPFDLGITLAAPGGGAASVVDTALSSNVIAGGTLLTLFAFVTDAPADNGNGTGTPLDPAAPADTNGVGDVFLSVLDSNGRLRDTVLVSQRATGGPAAGNGASRRPSVAFLANAGFRPNDPPGTNPAGFVHVAFESTASDLITPDTNARSDVFRVVLALNVDQDPATGAPRAGALNLRFLDDTAAAAVRPQRVSVGPTGIQGTGNASAPAISADANVVAFVSTDSNLLVGDTNGVADLFARILNPATTVLVSRRNGGGFPTGGASGNPRIAGDHGEVILFESAATNLLALDGNGVQDVFWARLAAATGTLTSVRRASVRSGGVEASGGASRNGSVFPLDLASDQVLVAFESDKTDLVATRPPNTTTSVYLFDSRGTGTTTLLAQRLGPGGTTLGSARGGASPADSFRPAFNATGTAVVFDTLADNLDQLRPADNNGVADVVLADLTFLFSEGVLRHHRLSVASSGADANGASTAVGFAGFAGSVAPRVASNGLPVAFTARLAAKFRNDRCVLCHGYNGTPSSTRGQLGVSHIGIEQCSCHQADPTIGVPCWHAPPPQFDLRFKTDAELCAMASQNVTVQGVGNNCSAVATLTPFQHFNTDDKITWAANSGRVPFTLTPRPLLPGGRAQLLAEVDAWIEGGFQCDDIAAAASGEVLWFQTAATNLGATGTGLLIAFPTRAAVERVSKTDGFPPAGGRQVRSPSRGGHITRDDRFVVFESDAALDLNDRNKTTDVYVRDLFLGRTHLVSHAAGSAASASAASRAPRACVDGAGRLHVAFESLAGNLVAGFVDRNGGSQADVFEADFTTFDGLDPRTITIRLVSHTAAVETTGGNGASAAPDIAAGASVFVAFHSTATDLVPGFVDGNGAQQPDVFRAQTNGATTLVSQNTGATAGGNGGSRAARLSDDGSVVVFESTATDLVPAFVDRNASGPDVYRFAFGAGMQLASAATAGVNTGGNNDSTRPAVSGDGLFVAFESMATDLVAGFVDGNGGPAPDVFLRDVAGGQTRLVSAATTGNFNGGNGSSARPALGTDGSAVGFDSLATDLLGMTDGNGAAASDVFLRDTAGNTTRLLSASRGSGTRGGAAASSVVSLGRKGGRMAFQSLADDLIDGGADNNGLSDVFAAR